MTVFDFFAAAGYLTIVGLAARWLLQHRRARRRAQVFRDVAAHRATRDLHTCQQIWPDPPSARVIETQWRHDTAKQRKENGK